MMIHKILWKALVLVAMLSGPATALAHGVHTHYKVEQSVTVDFSYEDHTPMAFDSYEIQPPDDSTPFQVGRTNRLGQCVFHPDRPGTWQVRLWTEDGHGATVKINVGDDLMVEATEENRSQRGSKFIVGVSVIFGIFGMLSMFNRRIKQ